MRTIAITNQKGGSGKTTTAVNLGAALAEQGGRVLLIDLDPQASLTGWLGIRDAGSGLRDLLLDSESENGGIGGVIRETAFEGLSVVASSRDLVGIEHKLSELTYPQEALKDALGGIGRNQFDYVLVDSPPSLGLLLINALIAAGELIVPCEAHALAVEGLVQLVGTFEKVKKKHRKLHIAGILACRVDRRTNHAKEIVGMLREKFPDQVYDTIIRENVRLAEAPSFAKPITVYDSNSAGAADYRALAEEVINQEGADGKK